MTKLDRLVAALLCLLVAAIIAAAGHQSRVLKQVPTARVGLVQWDI